LSRSFLQHFFVRVAVSTELSIDGFLYTNTTSGVNNCRFPLGGCIEVLRISWTDRILFCALSPLTLPSFMIFQIFVKEFLLMWHELNAFQLYSRVHEVQCVKSPVVSLRESHRGSTCSHPADVGLFTSLASSHQAVLRSPRLNELRSPVVGGVRVVQQRCFQGRFILWIENEIKRNPSSPVIRP